MLKSIQVLNIGIVKSLHVEFGKGLNIITGESGAGKSLLIAAMGLLAGQRRYKHLLPSHEREGMVVGEFQVPFASPFWSVLVSLVPGFHEKGPGLTVKRVITHHDQKCYINGKQISLKNLIELSPFFLDISAQFANQLLLREDMHLMILDTYAGASKERLAYEKVWSQYKRSLEEQKNLLERVELAVAHEPQIRQTLKTLQEAHLNVQEYHDLDFRFQIANESLRRLRHFREIEDEFGQMRESLTKIMRMTRSIKKVVPDRFPELEDPHELLQTHFESLVSLLETMTETLDSLSQASLERCQDFEEKEERYKVYDDFIRKFGRSVENVFAYQAQLEDQLRQVECDRKRLKETALEIEKFLTELKNRAENLSRIRAAGATKLTQEVVAHLNDMGIYHAQFQIKLSPYQRADDLWENNTDSDPQVTSCCSLNFGPHGLEQVEFLLSPNLGTSPSPLHKTSSGGELSRILLAIKAAIAEKHYEDTTFVFDEIDTGLSGVMAAKVGKKLSEFSRKRQSICVTHLPQVASYAQTHLVAMKSQKSADTETAVVRVSGARRVEAIAQMISGASVTETGIAQAYTFLQESMNE